MTTAKSFRSPADLAIPRSQGSSDGSASLLLASDAGLDEQTYRGGIWRSGQPITILLPNELQELWRMLSDGRLVAAAPAALGSRYVYAELADIGRPGAWQIIGSREWLQIAERIEDRPTD